MLTLCGGLRLSEMAFLWGRTLFNSTDPAGENDSFVVCLGIITQEAARWPKKALPP
jgi:hypothetical protein